MLEKYPNEIKIVFKNFPLRTHPLAMKAAVASIAAQGMGKFWPLHDLLFKNYKQLSDQKILEIALKVGIRKDEFEKKLQDPEVKQRVWKDIRDGWRAGVRGTPTVFINGHHLRNLSFESFVGAIQGELKKVGKNRYRSAD